MTLVSRQNRNVRCEYITLLVVIVSIRKLLSSCKHKGKAASVKKYL